MLIALYAMAAVVVLVTVLPFVPKGYWWVRMFDFPRPQIAVAGVLVLAGLAVAGVSGPLGYVVVLLLVLAVAYQVYRIFPYLPVAKCQVIREEERDDDRQLSLLVANVYMPNRRASDLLRIVRQSDPDVVVTMEVDDWWGNELSELRQSHPFTIAHPLDNTYGMILFSKLKLFDEEIRFVVDDAIPSIFARIQIPAGDLIDFYALHPTPPQPFQDTFERDAELLLIARQVRDIGRPAIVAGDLNDVAWSTTTRLFQRMSGMLDPRVGRGLFSSFHAHIPMLRWPLDHIFHDARFRLCDIRRLGYFGSDHFPIYGKLRFQPEDQDDHPMPMPQPGDHVEAKQRIEEGLTNGQG